MRVRIAIVGAGAVLLVLIAGRDLTAHASSFYMQVFGEALPGSSEYKRRPKRQPHRPAKSQTKMPKPYSVGRISNTAADTGRKTFAKQRMTAGHIDDSDSSSLFPRLHSKSDGPTYRTMCVRQCDGYYFPISFATGGENLKADAATCQASCGSPVALYYYPNPGADIGDMVSLDNGQAYGKLRNAYLYRRKFVTDCRCRPEPWSKSEKERHAAYAAANLDAYKELAKADKAEEKRWALVRRKSKSYKDASAYGRLRRYRSGQGSTYIRRASDGRFKRYSNNAGRRRYYMRRAYAFGND